MRTVNQNDYKNIPYPAAGYPNATIKSGGCGVCSVLNALYALGIEDMTVPDMTALSFGSGARVSGGTLVPVLARAVAKKYGDITVTESNSIAAVRKCLQNGGKVIANVDGVHEIFSTGGHYILLTDIEGDTVTIVDSGYYPGKYDTIFRRQFVKIIERNIVTALLSAVDADTKNRSPRFILIERNNTMDINKITDEEAYLLWQKACRYAATKEASSWAKDSINFCKAAEITDGTAPQRPATREEVCVMIERMINYDG